jgi:hypothetical protein
MVTPRGLPRGVAMPERCARPDRPYPTFSATDLPCMNRSR